MRPQYQNPLSKFDFPDPAALQFRGEYLACGTGEAEDGRIFPIMSSPDAVHWTFRGGAMPPLPDPRATEYWAPEVAYRNGLFYLYYAVIAFGTPEHHLRVAISDSPLGPFEDQGLNLTPDEIFAIDAHPFQDEDGQWYLFYARDYLEPPFVGTGAAVDRLVTMTSLSGRPARVLRPYAAWQVFERRRAEKGGVDWFTVEGPFTLKRRGRYVCLYSGGLWKGRDYGVAYAISDVPMGSGGLEDRSYRDDDNLDGPTLLGTCPGEVLGPGHNSVVKGPNNVMDLMVYHGWPPDLNTGRLLRIDPLEWHAGKPYCPGPTLSPQPAPPMPMFRDLFDRPDGSELGDGWSGEGGSRLDVAQWRIQNSEAITENGTALIPAPARENYLFEANLRFRAGAAQPRSADLSVGEAPGQEPGPTAHALPLTPHASAGIIAAEIDGKERLVVAIERDQIALRGRAGSLVVAPLPAGFRHEVYHRLLVERNAGRLRVWLDGLLNLQTDSVPGPARVGLWAEAPAAFDGIAVTEHFFDDFADGRARGWWADRHSHWDVSDRALVQPERGPARHEIAKGEALANWELHVDVQLLSDRGTCGVLVRSVSGAPIEAALVGESNGNGTADGEQPDSDQTSAIADEPRAEAWLCRLGDESDLLPASFDPTAEHHLRLEKWDDRLALWLDGEPSGEIEVPADPSRIALFTDGAAAAFRDITFTGLH